jgi:N-acetyl-alpha-D-muramate 1-phosphate uridylyltransferase
MIDTVMIFAAGFGTRMKGITKDTPKPLIEIAGKPFLHHVLEFCVQSGRFKKIIINTHYLPNLIVESVEKFKLKKKNLPEIFIVEEKEYIRETGGAIKNAKDYIGNSDAIFTINSDSIIRQNIDTNTDVDVDIFNKMEKFWHSKKMDFLLLLSKRDDVVGEEVGDFDIDELGLLSREKPSSQRNFTYTGLQIMNPAIAINNEENVFPIYKLQLNAIYKSYGIVNDGKLLHANSQEHIKEIEEFLSKVS